MPRTPEAAIAWARAEDAKDDYEPRMCLRFTRESYDVASRYPNATTGWMHTKLRLQGIPVPGAPVWWTGGSKGEGHSALSVGGGNVISIDYPQRGMVSEVKIETLTRKWGLHYKGSSRDINEAVVLPDSPSLPAPQPPIKGGDMTPLVLTYKGKEWNFVVGLGGELYCLPEGGAWRDVGDIVYTSGISGYLKGSVAVIKGRGGDGQLWETTFNLDTGKIDKRAQGGQIAA